MLTSIVICTDGRGRHVTEVLSCLTKLEGPPFEVCVVCGPTEDETIAALESWRGQIKLLRSSVRNISVSRNVGISATAGEIIAFLDDDAFPETGWLREILSGFSSPDIGGVGGFVLDHTGIEPQYYYSSADRLGNADTFGVEPAEYGNFPHSFYFPYLQGTNCAFRRDALVSIGGFDEEFDYYLDETDVCCRLNDAGWKLLQLPKAFVHHKFLPSIIRDDSRFTHSRYSILKNKLYFSLQNGRNHCTLEEIRADMAAFIMENEGQLRRRVGKGLLPASALASFSEDSMLASEVGMERGLSTRKLCEFDPGEASPFLEFHRQFSCSGKRSYIFLSFDERWDRAEAKALSEGGHDVRLVTHYGDDDRIDFEDGIWVYRATLRISSNLRHSLRSAATLRGLKSFLSNRRDSVVCTAPADADASAFLVRNAEFIRRMGGVLEDKTPYLSGHSIADCL